VKSSSSRATTGKDVRYDITNGNRKRRGEIAASPKTAGRKGPTTSGLSSRSPRNSGHEVRHVVLNGREPPLREARPGAEESRCRGGSRVRMRLELGPWPEPFAESSGTPRHDRDFCSRGRGPAPRKARQELTRRCCIRMERALKNATWRSLIACWPRPRRVGRLVNAEQGTECLQKRDARTTARESSWE